jgi:uncharacterized protein YkwD
VPALPEALPVIALVVALVAALSPTPAGTCWDSAWRCHDITDYRATHGLPELDQARGLQDTAKAWARTMAADGVLRHSTDGGDGYSEIVGMGPDWLTVMAAWDQSDPHRALLLDRDLEHIGIGVAYSDTGRIYAVVQFR